jgi:hypothetical protein
MVLRVLKYDWPMLSDLGRSYFGGAGAVQHLTV